LNIVNMTRRSTGIGSMPMSERRLTLWKLTRTTWKEVTVRKLSILLLFCFSALALAQVNNGSVSITTTGDTKKITNLYGGLIGTFEEVPTGTVSAVSITIQGCMKNGTCDTAADTYTGTTAAVRSVNFTKAYTYYLITATWTGSGTWTVNYSVTTAQNGNSGGGAVSSVFGRTGAVVAVSGDYSCAQVTGCTTAAFQANGTPLTSSATINFQNSAAFNGLTATFANPSAGNVQLGFSGTLGPSGIGTLVAGSNGLATSATTDTTNATNISSGTLNCAREPAYTGDATSTAGTCATTVGALNGTSLGGLSTGILKNTTGTGVPSIAVAGDFPTLNQNTTGTSANLSGTQTANFFYAAPNGSSGTGAWRAIVAADIPTLNQNTTGTASNLSGTPALPNGTTATTQTAGDVTTKIATDAFVSTIFAAPPGIGSTTPASGAFTTATASTSMTSSTFYGLSIAGAVQICGSNNVNCTQSFAGQLGSMLIDGAHNSSVNASANAGPLLLMGGVLNSTPNAASLEGAIQIAAGYLKGTTITAIGDIECGTTTAFTVTDCPVGTGNVIGIAVKITNPVVVVTHGTVPVILDNTATIGDFICKSSSVAGQGHDNGTVPCPPMTPEIGVVIAVAGTLPGLTGIASGTTVLSTSLPEVELHIGGQGVSQSGAVNSTGQTAAISTATLCGATSDACNIAGQYHLHWNFWGSGTACSSVTAGSVTFLLTWTDENAVAHSAVALQMMAQTGAATSAMQASFPFQTALANESASGDFTFSTNGSIVQYATGYTACTTGTGTYNLRAAVTRVQ
jgi:hypothetical protein